MADWIAANWYNILTTILWVVFGFLVTYFKQRASIVENAKYAINSAEKRYESVTKAGQVKFEYAVDMLYNLVPPALKPFITRDFIGDVVQKAFDGMEAYASKQLDKVFKLQETEEN